MESSTSLRTSSVEGADGQLQLSGIGDDVVLGACVDGADCDDGVIERVDASADDRLQLSVMMCAAVTMGSIARAGRRVTALAVDGDVHGVDRWRRPAGRVADGADEHLVADVQGDAVVGLGKRLKRPSSIINRALRRSPRAGWAMKRTVPFHWSCKRHERLGGGDENRLVACRGRRRA